MATAIQLIQWNTPMNHIALFIFAISIVVALGALIAIRTKRNSGGAAAILGLALSFAAVAGAVATGHTNPAPIRTEDTIAIPMMP